MLTCYAFLAVSTAEFIADLGSTCLSQLDFDEVLIVVIGRKHNFFDVSRIRVFVAK